MDATDLRFSNEFNTLLGNNNQGVIPFARTERTLLQRDCLTFSLFLLDLPRAAARQFGCWRFDCPRSMRRDGPSGDPSQRRMRAMDTVGKRVGPRHNLNRAI
jgi:hypothetical protein